MIASKHRKSGMGHWDLGKPLTTEENRALMGQYRDGTPEQRRAAREALVRGNQGLILKCVVKHEGRGVESHDLWQAGNLGLLAAIEQYSHEHDTAFSTYAFPKIRKAMQVHIADTSLAIRVPTNYLEDREKLTQEQRGWLDQARSCVSIHAESPNGGTIAATLAGGETPIDHERDQAVRLAVESLPDRERTAILLRYGFSDGREWLLSEIGATIGKTGQTALDAIRRGCDRLRERLALHAG